MEPPRTTDLLIVGGGINGVGIARDAAGRGLDVTLVEKDDLASHTSNWSSKLIHGGLRYLEQYEFRLVRESLVEREVLLRAAPHIIWPLNFCLPHSPEQRPAWIIRLGLFLYDHLGGREILPGSRAVDLSKPGPLGDPLKDWVTRGFTYSDAWVMDSRLTALNAVDAAERGAKIFTRTRCVSAQRTDGVWRATLEPTMGEGTPWSIEAKAIVNAAGPWVETFLKGNLKQDTTKGVRLVKGSHIVVPKLHDGHHPYILQNDDKRIVFVIPYEEHYSLIGTTDVAHDGEPGPVSINEDETRYLCRVVNRYFRGEITPEDVVWSYSGVRPLFDDASGNVSAVTRDYVFDIDADDGRAPLLSIFGGKITTYRRLSEHALEKLQPHMGFPAEGWTKGAHLPGGDIPDADFDGFLREVDEAYPWLAKEQRYRLARHYGTRIHHMLDGVKGLNDMGPELGGGLHEVELIYLRDHEFARTGDDVLWRRSKRALHMDEAARERVARWFDEHGGGRDEATPERSPAAELVREPHAALAREPGQRELAS